MNSAITARKRGDDYQGLWFWYYAAQMLNVNSNIEEIAFESSLVESFDDLVVTYRQPEISKVNGNPIKRRYIQVKNPVSVNSFLSYNSLADKDYINASTSLIQRIYKIWINQKKIQEDLRITLITSVQLLQNDLLTLCIENTENTFSIERFKKLGFRKRRDMLRTLKQQIDDTDENIMLALQSIEFKAGITYDQAIQIINQMLIGVNIKQIDRTQFDSMHISLVWDLHNAGIDKFDYDRLKEYCLAQNLFETKKEVNIGIICNQMNDGINKTITDNTDRVLNLSRYFMNMQYPIENKWDAVIDELNEFLDASMQCDRENYLYISANYVVSFMAGKHIGFKGSKAVCIQLNPFGVEKKWDAEFGNNCGKFIERGGSEISNEIGLVVEINGRISDEVYDYVDKENLELQNVFTYWPVDNEGKNVNIINGTIAWTLAKEISLQINKYCRINKITTIHIFLKAPIAFAFILGQYAKEWGYCIVYNYTFGAPAPERMYIPGPRM